MIDLHSATEFLALLDKIEARIDTPEKWCKGTSARNKKGMRVNVSSPSACQFCIGGAISKETSSYPRKMDLVHYLRNNLPCNVSSDASFLGISVFNDRLDTTHADVIAWIGMVRKHLQDKISACNPSALHSLSSS